ncbi:nucleoside-diphosphate kinase [Streptomyces sp. WA6-1-16]|uniref:nucleoside-diphosphate kinase n=1 Tax=Streptomyces sp. WA6-1-16 TaxID=2879427 RepID=UPI000A253304|nr:nucleoside-diphosphate kinase [Streptomyces sp. WA6-1-16]OSC74747.1 hypothetical protein B5180_11285 [Streptomyces sp. BF-3]UCA51078.1 nucleoside-diphosphate kinase [Streptomyces sp. WA6-1-16]
MTVDEWLRTPYTRDPVRRRTYPDDVYFRETAALLGRQETDCANRALLRSTFVMFKPDAIVGRRVEPALAFLARHGFRPLGALEAEVDARVCRELWRYQINAAPLAVIRAVDMILESGPPCLIVGLRDMRAPEKSGTTAAERLAELKGSSKSRAARELSLREALGCELMCLNFVHAPDDPADLIREIGVLTGRRREEAFAMLAAEAAPHRAAEAGTAARELYAAHPAHALARPEAAARPHRPADSAAALAQVEQLDASGEGIELWDRIVLAAELVEGLPSEGRPLIAAPPGRRRGHPWATPPAAIPPTAPGAVSDQ